MSKALILGCGYQKQPYLMIDNRMPDELVTLDHNRHCEPDVVFDLNHLIWHTQHLPFNDEEFDQIHAYQVLEHLGRQGDVEGFFNEFKEYDRILKMNGVFCGSVPTDNWIWGDPGHTRYLGPEVFSFLNKKTQDNGVGKSPMSDYRKMYDVNVNWQLVWEDRVKSQWLFIFQKQKGD